MDDELRSWVLALMPIVLFDILLILASAPYPCIHDSNYEFPQSKGIHTPILSDIKNYILQHDAEYDFCVATKQFLRAGA